jgi:hypothetical protein
MTNWHFRLKAGGVENSYYIVGSDREQALYQAQAALFEECQQQGFIPIKATLEFEERFDI